MNASSPNIKDVAREAGCSIATVSRVLNHQGRIGKATQKRVREVCKKMGYFPSAAGRNLRSRKTNSIGILFYPSCSHIFNNIFYSEIMEGLERHLTEANQNLLLAGYDISTQHEEIPKFIREGNVDGTILLGGCPDAFKQKLIEIQIPFLLLDTDLPGASVDSVTSDGFQAMIEMVNHLHELGHRNLLMIREVPENYNENMRQMGFEAEGRRLGIQCQVIEHTESRRTVDKIIDLIHSDDPVTAACFINDDIASNIMGKLQKKGIKVPDQISITGFDDTRFSQITHPPLTTINIDRKQLGVEGAKAILQRINDPSSSPKKVVLPVHLVKRDSVKTLYA